MAIQKAYQRINWENLPSEKTPIDEINLNKMDNGIDSLEDRVITEINRIDAAISSIGSGTGGDENYLKDPINSYTMYDEVVLVESQTNTSQHANDRWLNIYSGKLSDSTTKIIVSIDWKFKGTLCNANTKITVGSKEYEYYSERDAKGNDTNAKYTVNLNASPGDNFSIKAYKKASYGNSGYPQPVAYKVIECMPNRVVETNEYLPKSEWTDSKAGLMPAATDTVGNTGIFMSDGKWHTIAELKTMLGIG